MAETKGINVPITKAKDVMLITTDLIEALPQEVFNEILLQGFKAVMNRGMSKVTVADLGSQEAVAKEAMVIAEKNLEKIKTGDIRITGGKGASKVSGAVKTEAMRLAKNIIKDEIKRSGDKVSHYAAAEITRIAKLYLESDQGASVLEMAKANLEARAKVASGEAKALEGIVAGLKADDKLVAKANAKKKDKPLSAKQAGMTAKSKKATAQASA